VIAVAVAGAALTCLPALQLGYILDDLVQLRTLEGDRPSSATPTELWRFFLGTQDEADRLQASGATPWWRDVRPQPRMAFFRPLASAERRAGHALFAGEPAGHHAQSILWYLVLVGVVGGLLWRAVGGPIAALALALFAVDDCHWAVIAYVPARHFLVAAVFGLAGLWAHVRWREDGWAAGRVLSLAGFAASLLASEVAFQALAFALAYELAGAPGSRRERLQAIAPVTLLALVYLLHYRLSGYGGDGDGYFDLLRNPDQLLAVWRKPLALASELLANLRAARAGWRQDTAALALGFAASLAAVGGFTLVSRRLESQRARAVGWLGLGGALSLIPALAAVFGSRVLLLPSLGAAVVIAAGTHVAWRALRDAPGWGPARLMAGGILATLVLVHLVGAPVLRVRNIERSEIDLGEASTVRWWQRISERAAVDRQGPGAVVVLAAPAVFDVKMLRLVEPFDRDRRRWWSLSLPDHSVIPIQTAANVLQLTYDPNPEAVTREELPGGHHPGDIVELDLATLHIHEVEGGWPRRIDAVFPDRAPDRCASTAARGCALTRSRTSDWRHRLRRRTTLRPGRPARTGTAAVTLLVALSACSSESGERSQLAPVRDAVRENLVYGFRDGLALTFDVFQPRQPSGAGVLFIMSAGWVSGKLETRQQLGFLSPLVDQGFTVFAVRHASSPRYALREMVADVRLALRNVSERAAEFGIDPERLTGVRVPPPEGAR
jgi:hypothetical protein